MHKTSHAVAAVMLAAMAHAGAISAPSRGESSIMKPIVISSPIARTISIAAPIAQIAMPTSIAAAIALMPQAPITGVVDAQMSLPCTAIV